jgi:hypothetical protein
MKGEEMPQGYVDIVLDGPPSHESGRFVEVEDGAGRGLSMGEWVHRLDGYWVLRIPAPTEGLKASDGLIVLAVPQETADFIAAKDEIEKAGRSWSHTGDGQFGVLLSPRPGGYYVHGPTLPEALAAAKAAQKPKRKADLRAELETMRRKTLAKCNSYHEGPCPCNQCRERRLLADIDGAQE